MHNRGGLNGVKRVAWIGQKINRVAWKKEKINRVSWVTSFQITVFLAFPKALSNYLMYWDVFLLCFSIKKSKSPQVSQRTRDKTNNNVHYVWRHLEDNTWLILSNLQLTPLRVCLMFDLYLSIGFYCPCLKVLTMAFSTLISINNYTKHGRSNRL